MEQWAAAAPQDALARLGARTATAFNIRIPPSTATLRRVINAVCPGRLADLLGAAPAGITTVAVDGKTARGSRTDSGAAVHLLSSAVNCRLGRGFFFGMFSIMDTPSRVRAQISDVRQTEATSAWLPHGRHMDRNPGVREDAQVTSPCDGRTNAPQRDVILHLPLKVFGAPPGHLSQVRPRLAVQACALRMAVVSDDVTVRAHANKAFEDLHFGLKIIDPSFMHFERSFRRRVFKRATCFTPHSCSGDHELAQDPPITFDHA
ncbi:hypothetical protein [Streptomyces erythrochromogenes]|uniref:hypothetical protein n=1 Tax=Streptomyces erythrochromogenes TaxID=285574 RepID=UPI00381D1F7D